MKKKILYNGQKYSTVEEFTEALVENEPEKAQEMLFDCHNDFFNLDEVYDMFYDDPGHKKWRQYMINWLAEYFQWLDGDNWVGFDFSDYNIDVKLKSEKR